MWHCPCPFPAHHCGMPQAQQGWLGHVLGVPSRGVHSPCVPAMFSAAGALLWEAQHHCRGRDHLLPPGLCHRQPGLPGTGVGISPQLQVPTGTGEGGEAAPRSWAGTCLSAFPLPSLCPLPLCRAELLNTPLLGINGGRDTPIPGEEEGDRSQYGTGLAQSPRPGTALLSGYR